jgi:hypothetical protein
MGLLTARVGFTFLPTSGRGMSLTLSPASSSLTQHPPADVAAAFPSLVKHGLWLGDTPSADVIGSEVEAGAGAGAGAGGGQRKMRRCVHFYRHHNFTPGEESGSLSFILR